MIKAYIYGTPKGFDFYPQDRTFEDYLKDFYRTSRKGKRLMVNRCANGETVYSYLRYGLMEFNDMLPDSTERKPGRPNSFFGMSLVLDNNVYCPDFSKLFGWFDYLFDQILKEGIILKYTRSGIIQYQIAKFQDNEPAVSNLRVNLPNIFSEKANTAMAVYDESFNGTESAQIPLLNSEIESSALLNAFKKNTWLAISPDFAKGNGSIDIDCLGLRNKQNEINKRLVTFAVLRNENDVPVLQQMDDYIKYAIGIINNYLNNPFAEPDKSQQCSTLLNEYNEMHSNIVNLIKSIGSDTPSETKLCVACHQQKPISEFKNSNDPMCAACSASKQQCHRCGQYKPKEAFRPNDGICRMCRDREYVSIWTTIQEWSSKNNKITGLVVASCLLLTAVFAIWKPWQEQESKGNGRKDREKLISETMDTVSNYINDKLFTKAEEYLNTCSDKKFKNLCPNEYDKLKDEIYEKAEDDLWGYINDNVKDNSKVENFYADNLEKLNDTKKVENFKSIVEQNNSLCSIMQKTEISQNEHNKAENIIKDSEYKYDKNKWLAALPQVARPPKITEGSKPPQKSRDIVVVFRSTVDYTQKFLDTYKVGGRKKIEKKLNVDDFVDIWYDGDCDISCSDRNKWHQSNSKPTQGIKIKDQYKREHCYRLKAKQMAVDQVIFIKDKTTGTTTELTVTIKSK